MRDQQQLTASARLSETPTREAFLAAMAQVASPVAVITTGTLNLPRGLTATATCSLSADPPSILVCVNKSASTHDALVDHRCFAVNFLSAGQSEVASRFAQKDIDRFAGEAWRDLVTGAPILRGALVAFDCQLHTVVDTFSHSILVGEVVGLHAGGAEDEGLIWRQRRFCSTAAI